MKLPLEKQVCNRELSEKLKALGVSQNSLFYWEHPVNVFGEAMKEWQLKYDDPDNGKCEDNSHEHNYISAFTETELGFFLPMFFHVGFNDAYKKWRKTSFAFFFEIESKDSTVNLRAKMLIYLIENNLITITSLSKEK